MGNVKIPYYSVVNGRGFWQPNAKMRKMGFMATPCGLDGPAAWERAIQLNQQWKNVRLGVLSAAVALPQRHSLWEAFERYRQTSEWAKKAPRTREEWDRCWFRIKSVFGDTRPSTVTLEHISQFRDAVEETVSLREAHRCIKIWRALWKIAAALGYCDRDKDPSLGVRNTEPQPRQAIWSEGEVVRLAKAAWRSGYKGLAAIIAVGWDTQLSPVDIRSLKASQQVQDAKGLLFVLSRAKTGRSAVGTLSKRSGALVNAYIKSLKFELHGDAQIFIKPIPRGLH